MNNSKQKETEIYYNYKEWKRLEEISIPYEEALKYVLNDEKSYFHVEFSWNGKS
ncbi:hypothetical protein [Enterococcus faecium]|uniref:hypothetical protein n=1 Tax=Enterococcus faecium TaxID=1352 RepID=UPI0012AB3D2C|nr:hypothetical protein [Enterococcus faecium]